MLGLEVFWGDDPLLLIVEGVLGSRVDGSGGLAIFCHISDFWDDRERLLALLLFEVGLF